MTARVPFLDLGGQNRRISQRFLEKARRLVDENRFIGGEPVEQFEGAFAGFCGTSHCVALNSGTDALRLGLLAMGIGPEDPVITSPFSFIASAEAISQTGRVAFADVEERTFNLSVESVLDHWTPRIRAVMPVHIFGLTADMDGFRGLAGAKGVHLLEDASQAHGAELNGRRAGALGDAAAFSFYPTKNLGGFGDGGAVTTDDVQLAGRIKSLRNHGQNAPYQHVEIGYNSRLDALQAAALHLKLELLDEWTAERRRIARLYQEGLGDVAEVSFQEEPPGFKHCYHLLAVLATRRDELRSFLDGRGIETRIIYPTPIHLLEAYRHLGLKPGSLPVVEGICARIVCLPLYPGLVDSQIHYVVQCVRQFYGA